MDDANNAELQSALEHRKNVEAALDRVLASVGGTVARHLNDVLREGRTEGIPPEALSSIKEILNGKGYVEDADAQILKLQGEVAAARYHEGRRDNYWRLRNAVGAGQ